MKIYLKSTVDFKRLKERAPKNSLEVTSESFIRFSDKVGDILSKLKYDKSVMRIVRVDNTDKFEIELLSSGDTFRNFIISKSEEGLKKAMEELENSIMKGNAPRIVAGFDLKSISANNIIEIEFLQKGAAVIEEFLDKYINYSLNEGLADVTEWIPLSGLKMETVKEDLKKSVDNQKRIIVVGSMKDYEEGVKNVVLPNVNFDLTSQGLSAPDSVKDISEDSSNDEPPMPIPIEKNPSKAEFRWRFIKEPITLFSGLDKLVLEYETSDWANFILDANKMKKVDFTSKYLRRLTKNSWI